MPIYLGSCCAIDGVVRDMQGDEFSCCEDRRLDGGLGIRDWGLGGKIPKLASVWIDRWT